MSAELKARGEQLKERITSYRAAHYEGDDRLAFAVMADTEALVSAYLARLDALEQERGASGPHDRPA